MMYIPCLSMRLFVHRKEVADLTSQVDAANKKYQELSQAAQKGVNVLSALPEVCILILHSKQ